MKKLIIILAAMFIGHSGFAQIESHVTWAYAAKKVSATEAVILLKATMDKGWHIYSQHVKDGGPIKTSFKFSSSKEYTLVGKTIEPKAITKFEDSFKMNVSYFENSVVFQQKVRLKGKKATVKGTLEYMTCNNQKCLPPDDINFAVQVN